MNRNKILISSGLLVVAILCVLFDCSFARWMCLLAMFCSFVGDMLLLDISWIRKRVNNYFVCGALAFGLAHICYGSAYYSLLDTKDGLNMGSYIAISIVVFILAYFSWNCVAKKKIHYLTIAAVYICLIGLEFVIVMTYGGLAVVGAIFFLVSDFCLGMGRIVGDHRFDKWVWIFYPIGQIFLILCA